MFLLGTISNINLDTQKRKAITQKIISRVGRNPDTFAPKGTNYTFHAAPSHSKDDDDYNPFDPSNFNLLEARPKRTDKTTVNDMQPIKVTEQRA